MYINSIINVDVGKCVEIHIFLVQNLDESIFLIDTILMKEKSEETTTNEQSEDNNRHTTHRKNTNKSKDTTQKLKWWATGTPPKPASYKIPVKLLIQPRQFILPQGDGDAFKIVNISPLQWTFIHQNRTIRCIWKWNENNTITKGQKTPRRSIAFERERYVWLLIISKKSDWKKFLWFLFVTFMLSLKWSWQIIGRHILSSVFYQIDFSSHIAFQVLLSILFCFEISVGFTVGIVTWLSVLLGPSQSHILPTLCINKKHTPPLHVILT